MAADKELLEFVSQALMSKVPRDEIERILAEAGWPRDRVKAALSSFADVEIPLPVPRPRAYGSARDAFLYLVIFVALCLSSYYLGSLFFNIIDIAFPDPAVTERSELLRPDRIRWAIAMLVVSFPAYLILSVKINSEIAKDSEQRGSRVRKWLTYLTLFIAAMFVIGDLVGLVYQFLKGELTIRIGLQILTVAAIASVIFVYYLRSIGRDES